MKFTASADWLKAANGATKVLQWKVYIKTTTDISQALSAGTWVDVSPKIDYNSFPTIRNAIEYQTGQFTSDNVTFEGRDVAWWKANILTTATLGDATKYLELKIELKIGISETYASDICYMFAGFVDKIGIQYSELTDRVSFTAFSAEDLGSRLAAENVSTQYVDTTLIGGAVNSLMLQNITGMWVRDANLASFVLQVGVHTITYDFNAGTRRAKLDGATAWLTLGTGNNTLGNVDNTAADTQRIQVYVPTLTALPASGVWTDQVIVITAGTTLPKQWYANVSMKYILQKAYAKIGITTVNFDSMFINTYDGRLVLSYFGQPPDDESTLGIKRAMTTDGTDLYIGIGNKVYKRTTSTEAYSLVATMTTSGNTILRIWYNARVNTLWILDSGWGIRIVCMTQATTSETALSPVANLNPYACDVIDVNYTGSSWHQSMVYVDPGTGANSTVREALWDNSTSTPIITDTNITAGATIPAGQGVAELVFHNGVTTKVSRTTNFMILLTLSVANAWVRGVDNASVTGFPVQVYNSSLAYIYYINGGVVFRHAENSGSAANLGTITSAATLAYPGDGNVYGYGIIAGVWCLFKINGTTITSLGGGTPLVGLINGVPAPQQAITYISPKVYGTTGGGTLWQVHTTSNFYVSLADFSGMNVRDAIAKVLRAGNLIGAVSFAKVANVYRRGNSTGVPQTTGNSLALTVRQASDLEENISHSQIMQYVSLQSQSLTTTYDGTTFNSAVLSDKSTLSIQNDFIADATAKDTAYYIYQFFKTARNLYKVKCGILPLFQYEVFDNATLTFTTTKIQKTVGGVNNPIYACEYERDGSMSVEVMI